MLTEKQLDKYADVLLWGLKTARTGSFKKNDIVLIRYSTPAVRLAEILYEKLLNMGRNPVLRTVVTPEMEKSFYGISNNKQLVFQAPGDKELFENINGNIFLHAPESITHLKGIDPTKIGKAAIARKYLKDIIDKREEKGLFGWTLCIYPTKELARHAKLTMKQYSNQVVKACLLNDADPVKKWQEVYKQAQIIKKRLNSMKVKAFHVESKNINLEITPGKKRKWIGISGHNIPSFELFMSPDWRGTKGTYFANQPSYRSGNYVKDIRVEFKKGAIVNVKANQGEKFAKKQFAMDYGANKLGEFSLTDKRFSKINKFMANTLYDENFGGSHGNCHIALGASYSDTYDGDTSRLTKDMKKKLGFNDSALHWDIVNTEKKTVTAILTTGKKVLIYEDGKFVF
jgi:aminopeptidase